MPKINVLSKQVAEQIAAGEVIDRPASVVKELVENSIDAGATLVTVEIKKGGVDYIRITDNGCGISAEDVPTAFLRHATSKVSTELDLNHIATLGFRGEALASVCAVSKVDMLTKTPDDAFGTHIRMEGGEQVLLEESGCQQGTTIVIRDLFYNVPARLKFLKKDVSEANAVATVLNRIALSNPGISFTLIRDNQKTLQTPGDGKLYSAIYAVYGKAFAQTLMPVEYSFGEIHVKGYSSIPTNARPNRSMQHFFVNGRYVRSRTCSSALDEGYHHSMMVGKFPACVLNLTVPYDFVDVNVHPTKTEVRFINEKSVFDSLYFAVKSAIAENNRQSFQPAEPAVRAKSPSPFFEDRGVQQMFEPDSLAKQVAQRIHLESSSDGVVVPAVEEKERVQPKQYSASSPVSSGQKVAHPVSQYRFREDSGVSDPFAGSTFEFLKPEMLQPSSQIQEKEIPADLPDDPAPSAEPPKEPVRVIGEVFQTYIIAQVGDAMLMIDKHAAHERILYEQLRSERKPLDHQVLLSPFTVALSPEECDAVLSNLSLVDSLGFLVEDFGGSMLYVREIPVLLDQHDASQLLAEIALNLKNNKMDPAPHVLDDLYHSVACKAAVKAHDINMPEELQALAERVYYDEAIRYCPHGRPVLQVWPQSKIKRMFGR